MTKEPREIAVVIPTYNRAQLIGRAIDSVLMQSAPPEQILVVDDGSSDATAGVCQAYGNQIQYVRQSHAGPSIARNAGIRLARHGWVAFLDSDDYWTPEHLGRMKTAIRETQAEANFYFSNIQMPAKYDAGTLWELVGFRPDPPFHLVKDASAWMLMKRQPTLLQASVFRKSSLEKVGGLSEKFRLSHDVQLFCQLGIGGTACAVSGVGCIRTMDDESNITLNNQIPSGSERHLEDQCQLWQEILLIQKKLPPPLRRLVRFNLASSHLGMCKLRWQGGRFDAALWHLFQVVKSDPELAVWIARKRNSDGYASKVRPAP
jgi:glycosyltransferase involved in cell wall biosynthesis